MLFNLRVLRGISLASCRRNYSTATATDLRAKLQHEIKAAMKNRDTTTSMTLRSVMSEINSAEKTSKEGTTSDSSIASIIRKAIQRRTEASVKFQEANRPDLAEKEQKEADLLSKFLPPLLSADDIDIQLRAVLANLPAGSDPKKSLGTIFKEFYSKVDKSTVDSNLVKQQAQQLVTAISTS